MKSLIQKILRSDRLFSNIIIVWCVTYMSVYLQECLAVMLKSNANPEAVAKVAAAFFGGELLMICLAYRFGMTRKNKEEHKEEWGESV